MSRFDRFANQAAVLVARAPFFALCVAIVLGWLLGLPFAGPTNQLYHLLLNSPTTAITFLLVALLQNGQARFEHATNQKLNAISSFLAAYASTVGESDERDDMRGHVEELRRAVGIEQEMSA